MFKRLLITVALINLGFVSVAYAADNDLDKWNISQLIEANKFNTSLQESSLIVKNSEIGLHGRYLMTSSRCQDCHGFDNQGESNLINAFKTRDGSCNWCHGSGSASTRHIAMDNDDEGTVEYDTGHSHGYGLGNGKWKAPNDTYPAFTANFWMGGLSCFDCHTAHANPARTLGHTADGIPLYGILDPGFTSTKISSQPGRQSIYKAGRWVLKKNPDRELYEGTGFEIPDDYEGDFSRLIPFPVNKVAIDWDNPRTENPNELTHSSVPCEKVSSINELCVDCHDGNAGLHHVTSLVYSEEKALSGETGIDSYVEAHGHDSQTGKCNGQAVFNPEDGINNGPDCRSCHRGDGDCELCHKPGNNRADIKWPREAYAVNPEIAEAKESRAEENEDFQTVRFELNNFKLKHSVNWDPDWKSADISCAPECVNIGLSWPHRTLAWKMLKNELFGIDLDGSEVRVGEQRELLAKLLSLELQPAQDLDSVCLDCHNPNVWRPNVKEAFMRGLP